MKISGQRELREAVRELGKAETLVARVVRRAVNRAARHGRTVASRGIRDRVALKASYVNRHLRVTPARGNSTTAVIRATRRPVLLSRYGARPLTRKTKTPGHKLKGQPAHQVAAGRKLTGVSVKVGKNKPRKRMRGAFFIRLRGSGATGVAVRTGRGRDDYKVLHGPSVDQVFRRGAREEARDAARVYLRRELLRNLDYEMGKLWRR